MSQARAASEPLLWLQLLGLSLLPLEALLLLLLLAGSDPGPLPALERLLCWAIGGLAPAVVLWRRPADVWSLLLVQTPARGRRELQRRLSALHENLGLRLTLALGAALLLALLWRLDAAAALATSFAPLPDAPRLVDLLLSALVLALMLWQWQQAAQAVWLLSRSADTLAATSPLPAAEPLPRRLSLGLPLLLPAPLQFQGPSITGRLDRGPVGSGAAEPPVPAPPTPSPAPNAAQQASVQTEPGKDEDESMPQSGRSPSRFEGSEPAALATAVEPEQTAEDDQSTDLDQPIG